MMKRTQQLIAKWKAWKIVDDDSHAFSQPPAASPDFAQQAARELDQVLKQAARAEHCPSPCRLRWSVIESISTAPRSSHAETIRPWILRPAPVGALACLVALAVTAAMWIPRSASQAPTSVASQTVAQQIISRVDQLTNVNKSTQLVVDRLDAPFEIETRRLAHDVRHAWTFLRDRVTSLPLVNQVAQTTNPG